MIPILHWTLRTYLLPEIKTNWHGFLPLRQPTQSSLMMVILPLSLLLWLHFLPALELRCRTRARVRARAQTRARRTTMLLLLLLLMMMMMVVVVVVMVNFPKLALFVHANLACACAYWYIKIKNKNKKRWATFQVGPMSGHERSLSCFDARRDCWYLHQKGCEGHDVREACTTAR